MIIKNIKIRNFGAVSYYEAALTSDLNILDSQYAPEISAAIDILLCNKTGQILPPISPTTCLTAQVFVGISVYNICVSPRGKGLFLTATDVSGKNVTDIYQNALSHCSEQDTAERFDGQDQTLPSRLCLYRNFREENTDLSPKTESLIETKTFRAYLIRYIRAFQPERIHCKKSYLTAIDRQGEFQVIHPGVTGEVHLSQTEETLFRYICFLNVAEFWADLESLRNMHHEKKPLIIQNFLEYLDWSTDINGLIARTLKLSRQVIVLTSPLDQEVKKNWAGRKEDLWDIIQI